MSDAYLVDENRTSILLADVTVVVGSEDSLQNGNATTDTDNGGPLKGYGAGIFAAAVIVVYSLSVFMFLASYIKRKSRQNDNERQVQEYLNEVENLRQQATRDKIASLKKNLRQSTWKNIVAKLQVIDETDLKEGSPLKRKPPLNRKRSVSWRVILEQLDRLKDNAQTLHAQSSRRQSQRRKGVYAIDHNLVECKDMEGMEHLSEEDNSSVDDDSPDSSEINQVDFDDQPSHKEIMAKDDQINLENDS